MNYCWQLVTLDPSRLKWITVDYRRSECVAEMCRLYHSRLQEIVVCPSRSQRPLSLQINRVWGHAHQSADHRRVHESRSGAGMWSTLLHRCTAQSQDAAGRFFCLWLAVDRWQQITNNNNLTNHIYYKLLLQLEQELARKLDDVEGQFLTLPKESLRKLNRSFSTH